MQVSIRSCLVLLVLSVLLPAMAAAAWLIADAYGSARGAHGMPTTVQHAVLAVLALLMVAAAVVAALWASRRIERALRSLQHAATRLQAGLPVPHAATGIVEFDAVADAIQHTRLAEQRAWQNQRIEALRRLTGGVAHDVNNLLGVISNNAYLIQRQAAGADIQVAVAATLSAVEVGSRLTQHLLRFAGRRPVQPQGVALERFLVESQEWVAMVLGPHIAALVSVAPGTRPVAVDGGELELALINLALNARDAMPAGGRVWLKARNAQVDDVPGLEPGNYVLITVTDEGLGIAPPHIDPVQGFCVQAGGTAHLASTPGLGTTAVMVLPAVSEPCRDGPGSRPPAAACRPAARPPARQG